MIVLGILALAAFGVLRWAPLLGYGLNAAYYSGRCATSLGHLAQQTTPSVAYHCQLAGTLTSASWVALALGVALVMAGLWRRAHAGSC